jgi:glycosyltransferase involved in cell wall biosynthesis
MSTSSQLPPKPQAGDQPLTICALGAGSSTHVATRVGWFAHRGHRVFLLTTSPSRAGIPGVVEIDLNEEYLSVRDVWWRFRRPFRSRSGDGLKAEDVADVGPNAASPVPQGAARTLNRPRGEVVHVVLTAIALVRALRRCKADIVHVHFAYDHYAWLAGLLGCRPLVVTVMGGDVLFDEQGSPTAVGRWLTVRLLRQANYITTKSDFLTNTVERLGDFGKKAERNVWGVSLDAFRRRDPTRARQELGLVPEARIILSPRILEPLYRVDLVVEAMDIVRQTHRDAVLVLTEYGADPVYREQIERRIAELDLAAAVRWSGVVPYEKMPEYYSMAEVAVGVPSSDGLPQTLLEAMACETPNILSRLPRYEEIVEHRESAYFVDAEPQAIAAGIVDLLDDPALRQKIAEQGRSIVAEQANLDEEAGRVEKRYRELVATVRPRAFRLSALLSTAAAAAKTYARSRERVG